MRCRYWISCQKLSNEMNDFGHEYLQKPRWDTENIKVLMIINHAMIRIVVKSNVKSKKTKSQISSMMRCQKTIKLPWKSDEKQPTPMLSVASSLYIALPRDHRSSTWQPGRTTEEDYLGSKAISDNLLKAKSLLALVLNPLTTSMWRLLVMRSFPGGPGFTRIFTFKKRLLFVN